MSKNVNIDPIKDSMLGLNTSNSSVVEVNGVKYTLDWNMYVRQHNFMLQKEQEWLNNHGLGWLSAGTPIKEPGT